MTMQRKISWLTTTILEPFPVFYGHANVPKGDGPRYAAGSKSYHLDTPENRAWAETSREHLSKNGYTMIIGHEVR